MSKIETICTHIGLMTTDKDPPSKTKGSYCYQDGNSILVEYAGACYRPASDVGLSQCTDNAKVFRTRAVWDTGATMSGISEALARKMGLLPVDKGIGVSSTGQIEIVYYMLDVKISESIVYRNVKVGGYPMRNHDEQFIIGMDIIAQGNLSISKAESGTVLRFSKA